MAHVTLKLRKIIYLFYFYAHSKKVQEHKKKLHSALAHIQTLSTF